MNKCPECIKEGKTSKFYPSQGCLSTLMGYQSYYDEQGEYHKHDPNTKSTSWRCSNGHSGVTNKRDSCWCGWGKDREMVESITS